MGLALPVFAARFQPIKIAPSIAMFHTHHNKRDRPRQTLFICISPVSPQIQPHVLPPVLIPLTSCIAILSAFINISTISSIITMKLSLVTPSTLFLLTSIPNVSAWGTLGHETVAYVATNFVSSATKSVFQTILHNTTSSYLAGVATWADSFRYAPAGHFSAAFHFIDAEDHPPTSCGVKYSRDCGKQGCIVGAIQNYVSDDHDK